ncbi:alpha/beta fold hydrolase [Actinophytocola xanthii]|uniref:Alpha/beta hydrolase n=1 Tax=Actinophytocola xanthii TaxID=1912961 RepID=A0A1Q8CQ93_9PSEU|nr:alpha/beta hydrolase [Actinophytocola xanthii]OLF16528.1 alpha/beta hydrolase [Actinophytocola xanthii]
MNPQPQSQISPHGGRRVELPGRYGPIAALRARTSAGTGHPAPIALLVPGYTGSKEDFAPLLDPIAEAGFDAIAIDLPGQYESGGPDDERAYLPTALGGVLAELVGKLSAEGNPVLLLGHSFGGLVSRAAVLAGAPVVGLTLLGSGPSELPDGMRRQLLDLGEPVIREHGVQIAQDLRDELDRLAPQNPPRAPELAAFLRQRFLRTHPASLLGMATGLRSEPDQVSALARLLSTSGIPCLVACGEEDDAWPVSAQRDMAERLDADFAMILGARHSPNVENPAMLLDTLIPTWRSWLTAATEI